jgi:uncharacterized protein YbbC (DUF1343 family)
VRAGCEQTDAYLPQLAGKRVALVANQTTVIGRVHLVDSLVRRGVNLVKIFSPEHGFRGDGDEGLSIDNSVDRRTGIPIVSLYGKKEKPAPEDMTGIDLMIYDIQDVGVRFYTYISTLHYVMEACAESGIPLLLLDRPDPLGHYVDGPMRDPDFTSFVGLDPLPVVYGMTPGELARMINGEHWLKGGITCTLRVVPCTGWDHNSRYALPVNPSPNLKSMEAIYLYPSVCFFEGTVMSLARGTEAPFRMVGHPDYPDKSFSFVPRTGFANTNPLLLNQTCYGIDLRGLTTDSLKNLRKIDLTWLIAVYRNMNRGPAFFNDYFDKLAGGPSLRTQVLAGKTAAEIRDGWQQPLQDFMQKRKPYLLYPDFDR